MDFPEPGTPKSKNATRLDRLAGLECSAAKILEARQTAQGIEGFTAAVQTQKIVLLEHLGFEFPNYLRQKLIVAGERQGERALGFVTSETSGRIENTRELNALRQVIGMIAGQFAGDAFELLAIGQRMLDDNEQLFELNGDLCRRRQDHDERTLVLAGDELGEHVLHDFRAGQKPVEIVQDQDRSPFFIGQRRQRPKGRERIARARLGVARGGAGEAQAICDIPDGNLPLFLTGVLYDFPLGFVRFARLNPDTGEGGIDVTCKLISQFHGLRLRCENEKSPERHALRHSGPLPGSNGLLPVLDCLLGHGGLIILRRLVIAGRNAKCLFQPFAGFKTMGACESLGLHRRLALRRHNDFNDAHGHAPSSW